MISSVQFMTAIIEGLIKVAAKQKTPEFLTRKLKLFAMSCAQFFNKELITQFHNL